MQELAGCELSGLSYKLMDPDKLRRSALLVEKADTWAQNTPVPGGLFDLRMGTIDGRYVCQSCGMKEWWCGGHMGYIELAKPCFIPTFVDAVVKTLRCVCPDCSSLLIPPEEIRENSIEWISSEVVRHVAHRFCTVPHPDDSDESEDGEGGAGGCGAHRADYVKVNALQIRGIFYSCTGGETDRRGKPQYQRCEVTVTPERAYRILCKISAEHARAMGFAPGQHPSWMIWTALPVLPPAERPSTKTSTQRRADDDSTVSLVSIMKRNQELQQKIQAGHDASRIMPYYDLLQLLVGAYTSNEMQGMPRVKRRSGRESQGVVQKLKGKTGLVRGNMMGKRVDQSGRSVIIGDPTLSVEEAGLPRKMAMTLSKRLPVTPENLEECWERVIRGPWTYGGANSVIKWFRGREQVVDLRVVRDRSETRLRPGMVLEVHLEDGDWVLLNRQPTLHRGSMMAHRVRVTDNLTISLPESVTTPYNADFDGDEMNVHAPQSHQTTSELEWLSSVASNLRSPKDGGATIGLVQDALLAGYLLSLEETTMSRDVFYDCVMAMRHPWARELPAPGALGGRYTGRQLLSMAMPRELNVERDSVCIRGGVLVRGALNKGLLGSGSGSLLLIVLQMLGEERACAYLDNVHHVCIRWIKHRGFTFGVNDLLVAPEHQRAFREIVRRAEEDVSRYLASVKSRRVDPGHVERTINCKLNNVLSHAAKDVLPRLDRTNLHDMVVGAHSKGKPVNIMQIDAYVGQQNIAGGRIPFGMIGRTLPHFRRGDQSLKARGFVDVPYVEGLSPTDVFAHAIAGREGLIDTAIKTAETGYVLRKITSALSDIALDQLFTVRNSRGQIIQFAYGAANVTPECLCSVELDYGTLGQQNFEARYRHGAELRAAFPSLEREWLVLLADRAEVCGLLQMPDAFLAQLYDGCVRVPMNLDALVLATRERFGEDDSLHPAVAAELVAGLVDRVHAVWAFDPLLQHERRGLTKMLGVVIRSRLASKRVVREHKLSRPALEWLAAEILETYEYAIAQPGEPLGILAAQSIGEPQQQMTLNTFHFAGISTQNVTLGIPRIQEIIHCTRSPKLVNTTIFIRRYEAETDVQAFERAWRTQLAFRETQLGDVALHWTVEPAGASPERALHELFRADEAAEAEAGARPGGARPQMCLRVECCPTRLAEAGVSFDTVVHRVRVALGDGCDCVWSDADARPLFLEVTPSGLAGVGAAVQRIVLQRLWQQHLAAFRVHGTPGVRLVQIVKDVRTGMFALETDCRDLEAALAVPESVPERCHCNHPLEVLRVLGIECARQCVIMEIRKVLRCYGIFVDACHLKLAADAMCVSGKLMSFDRHGINHASANTMSKAAFEEVADVLTKAAVRGKSDELTDITSRIVLGRLIGVGTGAFDLLLDTAAYQGRGSQQPGQRERRDARLARQRAARLHRRLDSLIPSSAADITDPASMSVPGLMTVDDEVYDPADPFGVTAPSALQYDPEHPEIDAGW